MPATVDPMQLVLLFIIPFFLSMRLDRVMPSSAPLGQTRVTSASLVFTDLPADPCRVLQRQRHLPWLCFWPGCTAYDMVPACVCCVCDLVGQHLLVGAWLWQGNPLCILQAQASTLPAAMQHLNHRTTHCNVQPVTCTSMQSSTPLPSHCPPIALLFCSLDHSLSLVLSVIMAMLAGAGRVRCTRVGVALGRVCPRRGYFQPSFTRDTRFATVTKDDEDFFRSLLGDTGVISAREDPDTVAYHNTDWMKKFKGQVDHGAAFD